MDITVAALLVVWVLLQAFGIVAVWIWCGKLENMTGANTLGVQALNARLKRLEKKMKKIKEG